jgi:hypothetical protein
MPEAGQSWSIPERLAHTGMDLAPFLAVGTLLFAT